MVALVLYHFAAAGAAVAALLGLHRPQALLLYAREEWQKTEAAPARLPRPVMTTTTMLQAMRPPATATLARAVLGLAVTMVGVARADTEVKEEEEEEEEKESDGDNSQLQHRKRSHKQNVL